MKVGKDTVDDFEFFSLLRKRSVRPLKFPRAADSNDLTVVVPTATTLFADWQAFHVTFRNVVGF